MAEEAVVLTYLEWVRLLGSSWIRIDPSRVVRYRAERCDPTEVVSDLMRKAPDVGSSATDFVLAVLDIDILSRHRADSIDLGYRLDLTLVTAFHSFTENALAVHGHDARGSSVDIGLSTLAAGWTAWTEAAAAAASDLRSGAFLSLFGYGMTDRARRLADLLAEIDAAVRHEEIARSKDTMFFGWAYVLNVLKGRASFSNTPQEVKEEMKALHADYDTDQSFFARGEGIVRYFTNLPLGDGIRGPADIYAIAALKQYERYLVKRDGRDINHECFWSDARFLGELDEDASAFLVHEMGARLPDSVIACLKASKSKRAEAVPEGALGERPSGSAAPAPSVPSTPAHEVQPGVAETLRKRPGAHRKPTHGSGKQAKSGEQSRLDLGESAPVRSPPDERPDRPAPLAPARVDGGTEADRPGISDRDSRREGDRERPSTEIVTEMVTAEQAAEIAPHLLGTSQKRQAPSRKRGKTQQ